jgi:anaerobic selenocysteine-containing dehydrogenase
VAVVSVDGDTWWDGLQYVAAGGQVVRDRRPPRPYVEMTAKDAGDRGIVEGSIAMISTERGAVQVPVRFAPSGAADGHVFLPWGGEAQTGRLPPSGPLDRNGMPPWTVFAVDVERVA